MHTPEVLGCTCSPGVEVYVQRRCWGVRTLERWSVGAIGELGCRGVGCAYLTNDGSGVRTPVKFRLVYGPEVDVHPRTPPVRTRIQLLHFHWSPEVSGRLAKALQRPLSLPSGLHLGHLW